MRFSKRERGITLVALIITIVVIIILAMITVSFLFGENGLIIKAQEAKKMSAIEEVREKLEMATGTAIIDGKGKTTIDDYFELIESEGIIGDIDSDTLDNGDGTYDVTTNEGFIFQVMPVPEKDNADDILIDYVGETNGPRIKNVTATTTTNSATIEVEAVNAENAVYKYEYKKEGEDNWQTVEGETGSTCTINNLEENVIYNIRVTVEVTSGGNKGTATREINVRTGEMPTGAITFEQETWQGDGTASVVVHSSQEGYTIQYQIVATGSVTDPEELEEANWKPVGNGEQITGIQHNQTVYARLWDGHNGSSYASADIKDTEVPQVDVTAGGTTSNSVAVSVQVSDNESGMIESPTYTYSIKQTSEPDSSYKTPSGASNITANSYTFTGLTKETSYDVKVEVNGDKAGNIGIGYLANQTTGSITGGDEAIQTGAITFGNTTWSNNLASITVNTNTDYTIQYQVNGTADDGWKPIENGGTIGNLSYPSMVYARLYDGTNFGQYASASIIDNTNPQDATISLSNTSVTTGTTVTATVTHRDNESGPEITQCKYIWNTSSNKIGTDESKYTGGTFNSNGEQISTIISSATTYYLHVLTVDKAGNKWETVSSGVKGNNPTITPTSVSVSPSSVTLEVGETQQLTATVSPSNATNKSVTWSSNNTDVATVSSNGTITAKAGGTVTITARTVLGGKTDTCSVTVKDPNSVENILKAGDYVNYVDATGVTRKSAVLYDSSSNYGVEIITMDTVEQITFGSLNKFNEAMSDYNGAISTLNSRASAYNNSTYSTRARCVGSNPTNPSSEPGYFTSTYEYMANYNGIYKDGDSNYSTDWNQLENLGIDDINELYWLASRTVKAGRDSHDFIIRYVDKSSRLVENIYMGSVLDANNTDTNEYTFGLRPVFKLKSEVKVTGGSGTSGDPYTLGV